MKHLSKKAQISVEYLFIIGLSLAIIIPGSMLFFNYTNESNEKLVSSQINSIGKNVVNSAGEVYTLGKGSFITLDMNLPESVVNIYTIGDYELVIEYRTGNGVTEAVFFSDVKIYGAYDGEVSGDFHTGFMPLKIESMGGNVTIIERVEE
jgi:hypothetical protein